MNLAGWVGALAKPEYVFNPRQLVRRLMRGARPPRETRQMVTLPWGPELAIDVGETIGKAVWLLGVYELLVSEALWRLTEPGELAADVGANIGHMSSVLARRVGPGGRVVSFEPLPSLNETLRRNVERWQSRDDVARVDVRAEAVSDRVGEGRLSVPVTSEQNQGLAHVSADGQGLPIRLTTLAEVFADHPPAVMKLDIEGHELAALKGAGALIRERRIRDIVFEDHAPQPSDVTTFLRGNGYTVLRLRRTLLGPEVTGSDVVAQGQWEPPVYVATAKPERFEEKLTPRGWRVLGAR